MRTTDFFLGDEDPLGLSAGALRIDLDLLRRLRAGPTAEHDDIEVAVPLARLVHDDLTAYGTGGGQTLTDPEMRDVLRSLTAVVHRLGISEFDVPFRDFSTFRSWWVNHGAHGSWQARRELLSKIFDPLHDRLAELEDQSLASSLVEPISPHHRTGWSAVDAEISELRRHFLNAKTPQDYRNVGLDCVAVTEELSRQVYDPTRHCRAGEEVPPVANTKQRIERFVEDAAAGSDNAALRKLARACIEFAQSVKHSTTPSRREAGIAADAVIQLSNLLRRLTEPE
jgi:hypothetical protein